MAIKNHIGFETDLSVQEVASFVANVFTDLNLAVIEVDLMTLVFWHLNYKESKLECHLLHMFEKTPLKWLLSIDTEMPIDFHASGNYEADERNIQEISDHIYNALNCFADFSKVQQYSFFELKEYGIG